MTAWTIQENDVEVYTYSADKKYGYEIAGFERENYRPLLTCAAKFDSEQKAKKEWLELVKLVKEMNLSEERKGLRQIIGEEESKIVGEIFSGAK